MNRPSKQLSNPFSTGGGGAHFEACVQAMFVTLMLTGGYLPGLPNCPIKSIKLQGRIDGFEIDDVIVHVEDTTKKVNRKLAAQIKHTVAVTKGDQVFGEVIQAAWNDFNNANLFDKWKDTIALITGPLSATDTNDVAWLLDQARHTNSSDEFLRNVTQARFSSRKKEEKLTVLRYHLREANQGKEISNESLYSFLNCFHLFGYDLGREIGTTLSLLHSHMSQYEVNPSHIWGRIVEYVQSCNQSGGTIEHDSVPEDIREAFERRIPAEIPRKFTEKRAFSEEPDWNLFEYAPALAIANLLGGWDENNEADLEVIRRFTDKQ